ncbi:MAG: SusD/RagB family nutrient-binding outer membrane lipoprotein [Roseivirga sp.]|nr:SusD/RagB family nutrient-binding outer membrane lipoprotein [Roseivirga sp.]
MKKYLYILIASIFLISSCQDILDGVNDNPNKITPEDIEARLFLTGALLANTSGQAGHLNRIAGMYSGQLVGITSLYSNIYGYSLSTAESIGTWSRFYIGVVPNARFIREKLPDDNLMQGIAKVVEAHAIGTAASLFGDVPYSEIAGDVEDPSFDSQVSVLTAMVTLLDDAISDLAAAPNASISEDIYFDGDATKWLAAANTLKARYLMMMKNYPGALQAAQNGIADAAGNMQHIPRGDPNVASGDKNLFWEILSGARTGDIGTADSYLIQLLDNTNAVYRGNAKTDETARLGYYTIDENSADNNLGIIEQFEPQNLITYQENKLTMAEAAIRGSDFNGALQHLNDYRAWLNGGGGLNANFSGMTHQYDAYVAADFDNGGMENPDGVSASDALLREIIEERYISGFGTFMPYDDARRIRVTNPTLGVPFPFNTNSATQHPERMPYSNDELNTNSNAPAEDPGIFTKTEVNRN